MQYRNPELTTSFHEPRMKEPCICGSEKKFKKCCSGEYSSKDLKKYQKHFNEGEYKTALIHARRHFTWYALAHKAHTIHFLKVDKSQGEKLLELDINALSELLENIGLCYHHLGLGKKFGSVIENATNLIDDTRWNEKISYAKGLWYLVQFNDEKSSYSCIKNINIDQCNDPEVLSLYLQVKPGRIPQNKSEIIINKVIENSPQESIKLQYRVLKGVNQFLIFENKESCRLIVEAIEQYENLDSNKKSIYGNLQYAYAMELLGNIANNNKALENCKKVTISLIDEAHEANYKAGYIADLYKLLGDVESGIGNYSLAIRAYKKCPSDLNNVFLAKSHCLSNELTQARSVLQSINVSNLHDNGKFDLALTWAILALNTFEKPDIELATKLLKCVETDQPYFINLRDKQLIELLETKPKNQSTVKKLIKKINNYIILNPNICGIGINLNKILEDISD